MKSGDSRFPGAIGWLWRERGPLLCKHNRLHFLLGQKKGRGSEREQCFMLFLRQNTDHRGGREGGAGLGGTGVAEEEPFPSQLHLHFLCGEEVPCWMHTDLILG